MKHKMVWVQHGLYSSNQTQWNFPFFPKLRINLKNKIDDIKRKIDASNNKKLTGISVLNSKETI